MPTRASLSLSGFNPPSCSSLSASCFVVTHRKAGQCTSISGLGSQHAERREGGGWRRGQKKKARTFKARLGEGKKSLGAEMSSPSRDESGTSRRQQGSICFLVWHRKRWLRMKYKMHGILSCNCTSGALKNDPFSLSASFCKSLAGGWGRKQSPSCSFSRPLNLLGLHMSLWAGMRT